MIRFDTKKDMEHYNNLYEIKYKLQQENKLLKEDIKELFKENERKEKVIILKDNIIKEAIELTKNLLETEDRGYYQILFKEILKCLGDKDNE